jgi:hypothetical protein
MDDIRSRRYKLNKVRSFIHDPCFHISSVAERIRFRMIRRFLGLPDQHPDPLVTSTDPAPDPSIIKKNNYFSCFVTSL